MSLCLSAIVKPVCPVGAPERFPGKLRPAGLWYLRVSPAVQQPRPACPFGAPDDYPGVSPQQAIHPTDRLGKLYISRGPEATILVDNLLDGRCVWRQTAHRPYRRGTRASTVLSSSKMLVASHPATAHAAPGSARPANDTARNGSHPQNRPAARRYVPRRRCGTACRSRYNCPAADV